MVKRIRGKEYHTRSGRGRGKKKATWEEVLDFAFGELGLLPEQFYRMSWKDYSRLSQGYWLRHARYLEGCRVIAHTTAMVNGSKVRDPRRFWPLITDKPVEIIKLSPEEVSAIHKRYSRAYGNK